MEEKIEKTKLETQNVPYKSLNDVFLPQDPSDGAVHPDVCPVGFWGACLHS